MSYSILNTGKYATIGGKYLWELLGFIQILFLLAGQIFIDMLFGIFIYSFPNGESFSIL